jgi:AcrR family transcriptional regulator
LAAAVTQFARKGFVDTSLADVAEQAGVTVTAVYYHFSSKEDLFNCALRAMFETINEVASAARTVPGLLGLDALDAVIAGFWAWTDSHPDETALVHLHIPGVTQQAVLLRQEFDELHVGRAFSYLPRGRRSASSTGEELAAATLAARTLVDVMMAIHPLRLADGPLSAEDPALQAAMIRVARRIVQVDEPSRAQHD